MDIYKTELNDKHTQLNDKETVLDTESNDISA